jgi:hypothetical protein
MLLLQAILVKKAIRVGFDIRSWSHAKRGKLNRVKVIWGKKEMKSICYLHESRTEN